MNITAKSFAPNELLVKAGDPATHLFMIRKGVVAKQGSIVGRDMYFGDDFLLTSYFRPYIVRTLTYTDCFLLDSAVLWRLFQYGQFPRLQVR
jgi:hypothetical protein